MTKLETIFLEALKDSNGAILSTKQLEKQAKSCAKACEEEIRKAFVSGRNNNLTRQDSLELSDYLKETYGIDH